VHADRGKDVRVAFSDGQGLLRLRLTTDTDAQKRVHARLASAFEHGVRAIRMVL
jgi:hypothetical protein